MLTEQALRDALIASGLLYEDKGKLYPAIREDHDVSEEFAALVKLLCSTETKD